MTFIIYPLNDSGVEVPYTLDSDGIDIALTLSVQDLQDVTKRRGSFSKTITLAGTDANNKAFGYAYNIQSFVGGFTPNKRIRCALWDSGIQTFSGSLQLLSITKKGGKVNYEVGIFSEEVAFFRQIAETLLVKTAGVSGFNHTFSASGVSGTFEAPAGSGYVYGFIDGFGYSDAIPNQWNSLIRALLVPYLSLTPSFYIKQLVDLIFEQSGYRYESAFFNSERFKKLILAYAGGAQIQSDLSNQNNELTAQGLAANGTDWQSVGGGDFAGIVPFDTVVSDLQMWWDTTDYFFQNNAYYTEWDVNWVGNITNVSGNDVNVGVAMCDRTTGLPINFSQQIALTQNYVVPASGTIRIESVGRIRVQPNQAIDLRVFYFHPFEGHPIALEDGSRISMVCTSNPVAITTVDMTAAIPPEITQADLLSDLQKMFNLYFYQSPVDPSLIYIEPFNGFYTSGSVNWSQKIDQQGEHLLTMGDPQARKQITFKYRDSGDALGKLYDSTLNAGYASREWKTDNYYAKGEEVVETKCATIIPASYNSGLVIGRTFDLDGNGAPKAKPNGYRIAQYNYVPIPSQAPWLLLIDLAPTFSAFTSVPFISHIDNPYDPAFDLAFGMPKQLYYQAYASGSLVNYTNTNLFNTYWRNYIIETTSKESLQIEVPVMLDPIDIYQLDFRKPIYIDGILFRLLEIRDYVVGGRSRCTAVLRRILNLTAPATGDVDILVNFDPIDLVLDEMKPQTQTPNIFE